MEESSERRNYMFNVNCHGAIGKFCSINFL